MDNKKLNVPLALIFGAGIWIIFDNLALGMILGVFLAIWFGTRKPQENDDAASIVGKREGEDVPPPPPSE